MNTKILIGVVVLGGLFAFVAFNASNKSEQTAEINTDEQTEEVAIPKDIPSHVPMYPDSILESSNAVEQETEGNTTLSLVTTDSVADVNTWYRGALNAEGWAVTSDRTVGGYVLLEGENENIKVFMQAANTGDGTGTVTITQRIRIR